MPEVILRPMREDDLVCVLGWRNHPSVRDYMYTRHEITPEEHRRWFDRASQDPAKHPLVFEQGGVRAGFVNFTRPGAGPIADWGFYLAPDAASGSGSQLGTCALGYAFDTLSLHKVCGQALSYNDRSIRFHRRLGFTQEGLLRDQHFDGNDFHSIVCFGLLYQEWQTIVREDKT